MWAMFNEPLIHVFKYIRRAGYSMDNEHKSPTHAHCTFVQWFLFPRIQTQIFQNIVWRDIDFVLITTGNYTQQQSLHCSALIKVSEEDWKKLATFQNKHVCHSNYTFILVEKVENFHVLIIISSIFIKSSIKNNISTNKNTKNWKLVVS